VGAVIGQLELAIVTVVPTEPEYVVQLEATQLNVTVTASAPTVDSMALQLPILLPPLFELVAVHRVVPLYVNVNVPLLPLLTPAALALKVVVLALNPVV